MGLSNITGGHHIAGIEISYIQWTLSLSLSSSLLAMDWFKDLFLEHMFFFRQQICDFPFQSIQKAMVFTGICVLDYMCFFSSTFAWAWQNAQQNDALEAHIYANAAINDCACMHNACQSWHCGYYFLHRPMSPCLDMCLVYIYIYVSQKGM